jgi:1,4-dihydroxy-2-naphthoate octaprenyltransferase
MERRRLATLIGLAMIALGLIQAGSFAVQSDWIFSFLGLVYAILGVAYLWAEVYSTAQ